MYILDKALKIAVQAHENQKDRYGTPYILHPIRVMLQMGSEMEQIVAILHDVVEDSEHTLESLRAEGFPEDVVHAVDCLSKRNNEPYDDYIGRVLENVISSRVKIADLEDNMNLCRITTITAHDKERLERYHKAWTRLVENRR